ncbi:hypothetical protein BD410DRAFT_790053 [Rickenella mellea]|uniref:Uncharacterized protein n=1 Tax=Rickenella mellea TaxID=50990 RepID=A0A4Y7Q338_9AGAM|nr:hypothetical protein BD410DRAFT_790053 [Rickenella mellea]
MYTGSSEASRKPTTFTGLRISADSLGTDGAGLGSIQSNGRISVHPLASLQQPPKSSTYSVSTSSSSSTIPGVGMVSGRIIKRFGEAIIHFAEEPIIWRRLRTIRQQLDDERLRIAMLTDPKVLYGTLSDLFELKKNANGGHSVHGYPKRINEAATLLLQRIDDDIWPTSRNNWLTGPVANSILMCYFEVYWSQHEASILVYILKHVFRLVDVYRESCPNSKTEIPSQIEQVIHEHGVPVLRDFASSCPQCLLHSGSWLTTTRVYNTIHQLTPSVIPTDVHIETLGQAFNKLMTLLRQHDLILMYDSNVLFNATLVFESITSANLDFDIHLGSLLCMCNFRRAKKMRRYFRMPAMQGSLVYPMEVYENGLPATEMVMQVNVVFTLALFSEITQTYKGAYVSVRPNADTEQRNHHKCALETLTRLSRTACTRTLLLQKLPEPQYAEIAPYITDLITNLDGLKKEDMQILTFRMDRESADDLSVMGALYPPELDKL